MSVFLPRIRRACLAGALSSALLPAGEAQSDVVVSEFVARPRAGEGEWVEILNTGPGTARLDGWTIADATGKPRSIGDPAEIEAGRVLVLASRPESLRVAFDLPDSVLVVRPDGWPVLNDHDAGPGEPADLLVLADPSGRMADSVAYHEAWLSPDAGRSLERVDPRLSGSDPGAWTWSLDPRGATPGRPWAGRAGLEESGDAVLQGPGEAAPGRHAAVFHFRLPAVGSMSITLLDRDGNPIALLREEGPAPAVGRWVWGPGGALPPRSGLYYVCLRSTPETGSGVRACLSVWVDP